MTFPKRFSTSYLSGYWYSWRVEMLSDFSRFRWFQDTTWLSDRSLCFLESFQNKSSIFRPTSPLCNFMFHMDRQSAPQAQIFPDTASYSPCYPEIDILTIQRSFEFVTGGIRRHTCCRKCMRWQIQDPSTAFTSQPTKGSSGCLLVGPCRRLPAHILHTQAVPIFEDRFFGTSFLYHP